MRSAEQLGITSAEGWRALHAERRVARMFGESPRVIAAATAAGRYIPVMVQEEPNDEEDTWDVVAARELPTEDVPAYERLLRRRQ